MSLLFTEGPVPSVIPTVVAPIELNSCFEYTPQAAKSCIVGVTISSTAADSRPAQPAPTVLLLLKRVNTRNNSAVALRIRKFVDGLRATLQGLVNRLPKGVSSRLEEHQRQHRYHQEMRWHRIASFRGLSYSEYEVSTAPAHGKLGMPGVNLVSWSSVIDRPTTSVHSMDIDL